MMRLKRFALHDITVVVDDYETEKVLYEGPLASMPESVIGANDYSTTWVVDERRHVNPWRKPTLLVTVLK